MLLLLVSGIMLYVAPPGRYAHWVSWTLWGFSKGQWEAIHTIFSIGFIVLSVFHLLSVNWKAFVSYVKSKTGSGFNKKREFLFSTLLVLVFLIGTVFSIPPFKSVMDFSEHLKGSWESNEERAPVPHTEQLTLTELAEQLNLASVDVITRKLKYHKIEFANTNEQSLKEIAEDNNSTPVAIYEIISKKAANEKQGAGVGRKTIEDFARELDKPVDEIMAILKENNIKSESNETLRTIGDKNNLSPRDIYKLLVD